ncbi:KICSTOR complex protein kaptin-like isoform X2 [Penaeus monodon]|uniref:KICSTOR complex protein kaptin-like isoform X2 n=1 Tax=Penaeus monodon TaxID=6687 RepID=UPI0018A6D87D|nr:KICSTOR complex protein kaptin-like isoform X2 [Penaeus monodon]
MFVLVLSADCFENDTPLKEDKMKEEAEDPKQAVIQELAECKDKENLNFINAHFFSLPSQGNVYTLTPLTDAKGFTKILVASLQRKVFCLEYTHGRPCMRDVPFTYIPGGAEIVSIDAVNRSIIQEDFIIGITIIKKDDTTGQQSHFFNIYSDWDLNSDSALDVVSQNCLPLELDFVPYHLYHTKTLGKNGWETVWLLSGSDCSIHLYQSDDESHSYQEVDGSQSFPEFKSVDGITLWMDISYAQESKRDFANAQKGFRLPESDANDAVTCCIVCDIDQDGINEILIGTYGQVVLVYKWIQKTSEWILYHTVSLPCPVLSLAYCDVMGDGTFQLIVMTSTGIHILQHDPWEMAKVLLHRIEAFMEPRLDKLHKKEPAQDPAHGPVQGPVDIEALGNNTSDE